MKIERYVVGPVQTNCYFLINENTKEMVCIDPGDQGKRLAEQASKEGWKPAAVLLTHGHFDHAGGAKDFADAFSALPKRLPICIHEKDKATLEDPELNASWMIGEHSVFHADTFLQDDRELTLAGFRIRVLFTPGHTPGGCSYYLPDEHLLFSGDTLFAGSVGRTDFKGGSQEQLIRGIHEKLLPLPDDTFVCPGHGGTSTIKEEKENNPWIR